MKHSIAIAFSLLVLAALACGSSTDNTGVSVPTSKPAAAGSTAVASTPVPPPTQKTFAVGELVQVKDHTIMLNSAAIDSTGLLKANFSLENKGTESLAVSSLMSFEAKDNDGSKLEQDYTCGSSFDGSVLAGDKLKGDICWKATAFPPFKIYYKADLFSDGAIVWVITP
jgi:hypothetical protein